MKIKFTIILLMMFTGANAQYNFSFVNRYALMHSIVNTNLKKNFDADAKRLRENKVKTVTVGNDTVPQFEFYEINKRGFAENLLTKNELYQKGEEETEYNIKYNVGGLISWIYYSPEQTELFYEHDMGKLSKIKSVSYDNIEYLALFSYVNDLPDSVYIEGLANGLAGKTRFKIQTNDAGFINNIFEMDRGSITDTAFEVTNYADSLLTIRSSGIHADRLLESSRISKGGRVNFDTEKYMSFEIKDGKIKSFTALHKNNNEVYIYKTEYYYSANGLIDYVNVSKSNNKSTVTHIYKYKYENYN